jgi:GTP-binding protein EngB required for normal cell division
MDSSNTVRPGGDSAQTEAANGESAELLSRIAAMANELGAEQIAVEAADLAQRVAEGRFYIACVGQFKRGKSTLLDALVGEPILPTGIIPVTAVPTVVRFGERRGARVRRNSGQWAWIDPEDLQEFVSEERNPENTKGVDGVEVFVPSALLASGMCLVDTPGLGSVFAANTAATRAFIPHIDAAVVVVGADPPIAGEELALVEAVSHHVSHILVVVNKADRVTETELNTASAFTAKMLESRLRRPVEAIYAVSAIERLERRGPERDWEKFIAALSRFTYESGGELSRRAGQRGLQRYSEQLLAIVREERVTMLRPIEESERRVRAMRQTISDAERSMHELGYLFTAEQHRISDLFLGRRKQFLNATLPAAQAELKSGLQDLPRGFGPSYRSATQQLVREIGRKHVEPWLAQEEAYAEDIYRQTAQRFVNFANQFLKRLANAGLPELSQMPHALDAERGFRLKSQFSFYHQTGLSQQIVFQLISDIVRGLLGAYGGFKKDAETYLEALLEVNSTRVQSDINERVLESRHWLEADIRGLLRSVSHVAEKALEHARAAQASGSAAVRSALARLAALETELAGLLDAA